MDEMGNGKPLNEEQGEKLVEGLEKHPSKLILFVTHNDQLIGLTNCFINFATFTVSPFINIHDVVVLEGHRNKGVGRKLLNAVIDHAKKIGCSKITLEVRSDNPRAQALYKSLGFDEGEPIMHFWSKYL
jgi:ribosomal protein S18 acetylase RimI-like enzyme